MIRKLILSRQKYSQLIVVLFGSFFGLFMVMASVQLFFDFKELISNKEDLISPQFLVINKPVTALNTITLTRNSFDEAEIRELQQVPSVSAVGTFKASRFKAQTAFSFMGNAVYTDIFFEAVPDRFLDIKAKGWQWHEGDPIPVILPAAYIKLYNFGFAPSQKLPQITEDMAQVANLNIRLKGNGTEVEIPGRIAGFTNRINSILVPERFLDYANKTYGDGRDEGPTRLVVVSEDPSDPSLSKFLEQKDYETNLEELKNSKLNAILKLILAIVLFIGAVIILLSVLGFVQYAQLLINNSEYEIKTLLHLGYYHPAIFKRYAAFYGLILFITAILCAGAIWAGKTVFNNLMHEKGYEMNAGIHSMVWYAGAMLLAGFMAVSSLSIYRMIRGLAKPR